MADSPVFLVTYPIPEVGMAALRAAGRVHVPIEQPTPEELADACGSGEFDVVVAAPHRSRRPRGNETDCHAD